MRIPPMSAAIPRDAGHRSADRTTSVVTGFGAPEGITQTMTYLPGGRLQTLTDGKGNKTTYAYDAYWTPPVPNSTVTAQFDGQNQSMSLVFIENCSPSSIAYFFDRPDLVAEVNQIGVELMRAHAITTQAVGTPSPIQIARYHWDVFANHGLHPSAFGGSPYFGARWEAGLTAGIWLDCH